MNPGYIPSMESESACHGEVFRLVLTGGPCAGKTTALARLAEYLRKHGFVVLTAPEAATLLFSNGAACADKLVVQEEIFHLQIALEDSFCRIARGAKLTDGVGEMKRVVLCDRGVMDGSAYVPSEWFNKLLADNHQSLNDVREKRYEAIQHYNNLFSQIFHLETAAKGAEEFYTTENNTARKESPEEARQMDDRVMHAWLGHPNLVVIGNYKTFDEKLTDLERAVSHVLGLPSSWANTVRFLLAECPQALPFPCQEFLTEKVYLVGDGWTKDRAWVRDTNEFDELYPYAFVRKRVQIDGAPQDPSYTFSRGDIAKDGQLIEETRIISEREYNNLVSSQASPMHNIVRQRRWSFVWRGHFYEIKSNIEPVSGLTMLFCQGAHALHREMSDPDVQVIDGIEIPSVLKVERNITGDPHYFMYTLARIQPFEAAKD